MDIRGFERIQHRELSRIVQQATCQNHFSAEIASLSRDDSFQDLTVGRLISVLDVSQFFLEAKLHVSVTSLPERSIRQLIASDSVGETRDVNNTFVGIEKLWLTAR